MSEFTTRPFIPRWVATTAAIALVATGSIVGTSAADAAAPYSISGTVLGVASPGATPAALANVDVYLYRYDSSNNQTSHYTSTDETGHFDFDNYTELGADSYSLWFNPCSQQTATPCDYESYATGDGNSTNDDDRFALTAGVPAVVKNQTLDKAGIVSGILRDISGNPVVGEYVFAEPVTGFYSSNYGAQTDATGAYTLSHVRPGPINITSDKTQGYDESAETRDCYHPAFQGGAKSAATATPLNIAIASTTLNVDLAYSLAPSVRGQVVDAEGDGVPWVGSVPFHLNDVTDRFDGPRSGPYGTDGNGWWLYCPQAGETYKYLFSDALTGGEGGEPISRTVPVVSGWAGGTSGTRINQAPSYGPLVDGQYIDAGKLTLVPLVPGSALFSLGTPRVVADEGYPDELFTDGPSVSPGDATQSARQWYRNGVPLSGETGYSLNINSAAESGTQYSVQLTYTRSGSADLVLMSNVYTVGGPPADETFDVVPAPTVTSSGGSVVGDTLTAHTGTWSPTASFAYQWMRGSTPITDATTSTYQLTSADIGANISVTVTGTKSGYDPAVATSTTVGPVTAVAPVPFGTIGTPGVSGTTTVGQQLSATTGTWSPVPDGYAYQWLRGATPIPGATAATYLLDPADAGASISVRVIGTKTGYIAATSTSAAVGPITVPVGTLGSATPTISGSKKVGVTLTANVGIWSPTPSFAYQWLRNGLPIGGATASAYKTVASDLNTSISIVVTGSKDGYTTASATSATSAIAKGNLATKTPKISGTVKVGKKLTVKPGSWTSGTRFTYRWYRLVGTKWKSISSATKSTYTLKSTDKSRKVRVKVSGTAKGYASESEVSKTTKKVS